MEFMFDLHWQSDWNGDEVGYDDINIVGLYSLETVMNTVYFYIDMETGAVLEAWTDGEEH
jgi:hypothetical protein